MICAAMFYKKITKRLATANRSHVSIRISENLGCVVDHENFFLTSGLIAMQNVAAVSHMLCAHMYESQKFGDARSRPVGWGVADHRTLFEST